MIFLFILWEAIFPPQIVFLGMTVISTSEIRTHYMFEL